MSHWILLAIAIVSEIMATSALKASESFTRPGPSLVAIVGYGIAFYFLSAALRTLPIGVAYAIWSGVGISLLALIGVVWFEQRLDPPAVVGIGLIVVGVLVLCLFSRTTIG